MNWIEFKQILPKEGCCIVAIRVDYPRDYWVGYFDAGLLTTQDIPTHWVEIPKLPYAVD